MPAESPLPLVYSCSGCSSSAQAADVLARQLDREGLAEMSCVAGVGGKVSSLVKRALEARQVVAIDGCPLSCAWACLQGAGRIPDLHLDLSRLGLPKLMHMDPEPRDLDRAMLVARFEIGKLNPAQTQGRP